MLYFVTHAKSQHYIVWYHASLLRKPPAHVVGWGLSDNDVHLIVRPSVCLSVVSRAYVTIVRKPLNQST